MNDEKIAQLRSDGIMLQRDGKNFSVRIGAVGGHLTARQLKDAADLAERFGDGAVHLTTRQAVEIHHVPEDRMDEFISAFRASSLKSARSGPRVRTVVSCPGEKVCRFAGIDSQAVARAIEDKFGPIEVLPAKIKIAVAGCRNSCTRAQFNDIGIIGAGKGRYELFVGGKGGRTTKPGQSRGVFESAEELLKAVDELIREYSHDAAPKHRIGQWLEEKQEL